MIIAKRFHDISCGHRVVGHEGKCCHLHGHNFRIHFTCQSIIDSVDAIGRVMDFSEIKSRLCMWLEDEWDHRFLAWHNYPLLTHIAESSEYTLFEDEVIGSIVWLPFNPTAENIAAYLVNIVGPRQLEGTGIRLIKVTVEETDKCSATYSLDLK